MAFQDATFGQLQVLKETTLGVIDSGGSRHQINATNGPVKRDRQGGRPNVWTGDLRRHPSRILDSKGMVTASAPLQHENMLAFYEGLFASTRGAAITVTGTDIEFDATLNQIQRPAGLGVFAKAYMLCVYGAGEEANNGWKGPVLTSAAAALTLPAGQLVDEAAGATIRLNAIPLLDGIDDSSYSIQWFATVLNRRRNMLAGRVNSGQWSWQNGQYITEQFEILGRTPAVGGANLGAGIAAGYPKTGDFFSAVEDLKKVYVGNAALGANELCMSQLQLAIRRNRQPVNALANMGPKDYHLGPIDGEITGEAYLDADAIALLDAIEDNESFFAYIAQIDPAGLGLCWLNPANRALAGDEDPGEAGNIVKFAGLRLEAHDPKKDTASDFYTAGAGVGFQHGIFFSTPS